MFLSCGVDLIKTVAANTYPHRVFRIAVNCRKQGGNYHSAKKDNMNFEELYKLIPERGVWALYRCDPTCTMGKFLAGYEWIENEKVHKCSAYGETPEQAIEKLVGEIKKHALHRNN